MWRVDLEHDILGELHTDWTSNHGAQELARQLTRDMPTWRVTLTGQVRDDAPADLSGDEIIARSTL